MNLQDATALLGQTQAAEAKWIIGGISIVLALRDLGQAFLEARGTSPVPWHRGGNVTKAIVEKWRTAQSVRLILLFVIPLTTLVGEVLDISLVKVLLNILILALIGALFWFVSSALGQYLWRLITKNWRSRTKIGERFSQAIHRLNERKIGSAALLLFIPFVLIERSYAVATQFCGSDPQALAQITLFSNGQICGANKQVVVYRQAPNSASQPLAVVPRVPPPPKDFMVYFEFGQFTLAPGAKSILDSIDAKSGEAASVVGHADRAGSSAYNQLLSEQRAHQVADYLQKRGISIGNVVGNGEIGLPVSTTDGVREPANRSVAVTLGPPPLTQ